MTKYLFFKTKSVDITRFQPDLNCKVLLLFTTNIVKNSGKITDTWCIIYIEDIPKNKSQLIARKYFVIIKIERQRIYE